LVCSSPQASGYQARQNWRLNLDVGLLINCHVTADKHCRSAQPLLQLYALLGDSPRLVHMNEPALQTTRMDLADLTVPAFQPAAGDAVPAELLTFDAHGLGQAALCARRIEQAAGEQMGAGAAAQCTPDQTLD
jgi:hypothetical protein